MACVECKSSDGKDRPSLVLFLVKCRKLSVKEAPTCEVPGHDGHNQEATWIFLIVLIAPLSYRFLAKEGHHSGPSEGVTYPFEMPTLDKGLIGTVHYGGED